MSTSLYKELAKAWQDPAESYVEGLMRERVIAWRRGPSVVRVEKPTKLHTARRLGYKAKKGLIIVRVRVRRGSLGRPRPRAGRRPKAMGAKRIRRAKSKRLIALERAAQKYPNLKAVNSYAVWRDGVHEWFEVIMADPTIVKAAE
ncbi:MAG: 50S ribosomal protein L15e [Candidatus Bathyarchaeia archaeon]